MSLRALGAREVGLHVGALHALTRGGRVRPWLLASILGDLTDVSTTIASRQGLPRGSARATVFVGGGSAALTALLAAAADS